MSEGLIIAFVLIRIGVRERRQSAVEGRTVPEIAGDRDAVTRAGVGAGQGMGADPAVLRQSWWDRALDFEAALPVPELADVEIPSHSVGTVERLMVQEDVTCLLHQMLAGHDARPVVGVPALADKPLEYRCLGLFG